MPLRDLDQFHRWVEREGPSIAAQQVARHFLAEVGDESWRYPSIPIAALSNQPEYEVRQAELSVPGEVRSITLFYRHFYATDDIDVIAISDR